MTAGAEPAAARVAVLLLASDRVEVPWRNGGGTTTVVASSGGAGAGAGHGDRAGAGGADPDWRVSIAEISQAGEFSFFPGIDRVLTPLSPGGLTLAVGDGIRRLARFDTIEFAGEETVAAVDVTAPGSDLNLMTKRGACRGTVEVHGIEGAESFTAAADETVLLVVVEGELSGADGPLMNRDAVMLPSGAVAELAGRGRVAVVTVSRSASE